MIFLGFCNSTLFEDHKRLITERTVTICTCSGQDVCLFNLLKPQSYQVLTRFYCLTRISIRAKRSISRVFSFFIVPSPFFVHCPYKGRINRAKFILIGLKRINRDFWLLSLFLRMEKKLKFSQAINFLLTGLRIYTGESKARGPRNARPSVGHYVGPWALHSRRTPRTHGYLKF